MMAQTIRTFLAIDLPPHIQETISPIQTQLRRSAAQIKWVKPSQCHITLKFLGDLTAQNLDAVRRMLRDGRFVSSFRLTLGELGAFPSLHKPQVLWVGLTDHKHQLTKLAQDADRLLATIAIPPELHSFHPHLTLGRVKSDPSKELPALIKSINVEPHEFHVTTMTLFQSVLSSDGPTYTVIETYELNKDNGGLNEA